MSVARKIYLRGKAKINRRTPEQIKQIRNKRYKIVKK